MISENDPFLSFDDWLKFLQEDEPEEKVSLIRKHARTGRPLDNEGSIRRHESQRNQANRYYVPHFFNNLDLSRLWDYLTLRP